MKGVRRDRYGLRAYVYANGQQREKRFPYDTLEKTIKAWRDETRVALRKIPQDTGPPPSPPESFAADVQRYLLQVRAMPTYAQRSDHLALWLTALGSDRPRATISEADIRAVLQIWRLTLSAATCNKRRTALMHLWTLLDGKGASNPVRGVRKFRVDDPLPRGRDPHVIDAALKTAPRCRSRASCRVLLWTGFRPVELQHAQPEDLNLPGRTVIARTAKGGRTRVIALTAQAVSAWKEFDRIDTWGRVPQAAPLNRWLKKVTGLNLRVYDLRHTYGTALATRDTRLDVIGAMMGHSTLELTKRYTLAAVAPAAVIATRKLTTARKPARKTRPGVARSGPRWPVHAKRS